MVGFIRLGEARLSAFYVLTGSCSITVAIAVTINRIIDGETSPIFLTNRSVSIPRNCNVSTTEDFVRPFMILGSNLTCQTLPAKESFHSVIGR